MVTTRGVVNCFVVLHYKNKLIYIHFFRPAQSLGPDWRKWGKWHQDFWLDKIRGTGLDSILLVCTHSRDGHCEQDTESLPRLCESDWTGLDSNRLCWCVRTLMLQNCQSFLNDPCLYLRGKAVHCTLQSHHPLMPLVWLSTQNIHKGWAVEGEHTLT